MDKLQWLVSWFDDKDGAIVALSGGVDSALVAKAALLSLGRSAVAVTADYRTLSSDELDSASTVAKEMGIEHIVIRYDELENADFVKNDQDRCFHCRSELARHLIPLAKSRGIRCIVDGTHADDLGDYRPGIAALQGSGIRSPLVEVGMQKSEVRRAARMLGISIHDRPSNSCLASRVPWGQAITSERLVRIDLAERYVRQMLGIRQIRVRDLGGNARIEVLPHDIAKVQKRRGEISSQLRLIGFDSLEIDPDGYRTGKLNVIAD